MAKILVTAHIDVDPAKRDDVIRSAKPYIDGALSQDGILFYTWSADLQNPARIEVFEEWESEQALADHLAGPHYAAMAAHIGGAGITEAASAKYLVAKEGPVYNAEGIATADFD